jgi:uncharacterized membrane protein YdbT with pleckstrin-like domain
MSVIMPPEGPEQTIWEGHPSQLGNLGVYLLCLLLVWLLLPLFYALWRALVLRCIDYRFTSHRFTIEQGVFARRMDELELYRVKDIVFEQSLLQRLFGIADLVFVTSDRTRPTVRASGLREARALRERLRLHVEQLRDAKGIREVDLAS